LVPVHAAPVLCTVSHARPHPPQLVMVFVAVSHPFWFEPDVSQSAKPTAHPV
jgi:hypothetical protein